MEILKWGITNKCNLNCKHCVLGKTNLGKDMPLDSAKKVIDYAVRLGCKEVLFSVKEPFCYENFGDLVKYCRINNLVCSILTNGTYVAEKDINQLYKSYINYIAVSLEGISSMTNDLIRGEGTFEKTIKFVNRINDLNSINDIYVPLILQICITPMNIQELIEYLPDFIQKYKFAIVTLGNVYKAGNALENPDIVMDSLQYKKLIYRLIGVLMSDDNFGIYRWKDLLPYDAAYLNLLLDSEIELHIPYCSMFKENQFYLLPNGDLCRCNLLIGTDRLPDDELYLDKNFLDKEIGIIPPLSEKYKAIKNGFCKQCFYKNKCSPCLFCYDKNDIDEGIKKECQLGYEKVSEICNLIFEGNINFSLKKDSVITFKDEKISIIGKNICNIKDAKEIYDKLIKLQCNESGNNKHLGFPKKVIETLCFSGVIQIDREEGIRIWQDQF